MSSATNFHPVTLDELLVVAAFFGHIGASSIYLNFEVRRDKDPSTIVATGKYILVTVARGEFKPMPVPHEIRERLEPYVEMSS